MSSPAEAAVRAPSGKNAPAAAAAADDGVHSKKGSKRCARKGQTAHIFVSAAGEARVSWKVPGGRLHSRYYKFTPDGLESHPLPTWHKNVKWKVTSTYGRTQKNLSKAYAYCSTDGRAAKTWKTKVTAKRTGTKRCGAGQQVMIYDLSLGHVRHKFKYLKKGSKLRVHDLSRQGYLLGNRVTPTGLRKVKWVANAHEGPYQRGGVIKKIKLTCVKN
ncbi:hypothetical protein [Streptomyces decoyicus]|uniref:hypothetical protein n=1 Tax=Streptomyces decoyicus TaxID=249567 RepID=UPI002E191E55|nr:hypothetical protein OG532_15310 [Streptomyces decoyicus]